MGAILDFEMSSTSRATPLRALAETARDGLRRRFDERVEQIPRVETLATRVFDEGWVSVNLKPEAMRGFLDSGQLLNKFEFIEQQATSLGRDVDELLRENLGGFYARRMAFEQAMGERWCFHYGALNIGGLGPPRYGPYCVVLGHGPSVAGAVEPIWVQQDSLMGPWWSGTDELDSAVLSDGIAVAPEGHVLTALKLSEGGTLGPEANWVDSVCNDDDYVEALFATAPVVGEARAVRASTEYVADLERRALDSSRQPSLLPDPQFRAYEQIRDMLDQHGIDWEEVQP